MTSTPDSPTVGYADVDGLRMYYEVHGDDGPPLLLLHGGLHTIELSFGGLLPGLVGGRRVIAAELQGHGRTADIERPPSFERLADDVTGLLDHLGIAQADFFGFSLGGLVSLQMALRHPERVRRLVLASTQYQQNGYRDEIRFYEQYPNSPLLPTEDDFREMHEAYVRVAPDPESFSKVQERTSGIVHSLAGWSEDELRGLRARTLVLVGDRDFVRLDHATRMFELIPDAELAVLPGTTHAEVPRRADAVLALVRPFLSEPTP